jgi:hypothetical protein
LWNRRKEKQLNKENKMLRWKRVQDDILTPTDLAQIVSIGASFTDDEVAELPKKGITIQLPTVIHGQLDSLVSAIPGMSKGHLATFFIDAAIYEFCKSYVENSLFPPEEKMTPNQIIDEAINRLKNRGK